MTDTPPENVEALAGQLYERCAIDVYSNQGKIETYKSISHEAADMLRTLYAEVTTLRDDLEDLQGEFDRHQEKLSTDFEGDCWIALRNLLTKAGWTDWSDPDGVTAEQAYEYLTEKLDELETELNTLRDQAVSVVTDEMVETATMVLLGHETRGDLAPDVDWKVQRDWTISIVRKQMRKALSAITTQSAATGKGKKTVREEAAYIAGREDAQLLCNLYFAGTNVTSPLLAGSDITAAQVRNAGYNAGLDAAATAMCPMLRSLISRGQAYDTILALKTPDTAKEAE
ncbi:MAG: hypothetical protein JKY94_10455 [Rhodobacteraceae bacterium]|nr:hypothetical protein [Paracoccaceae bacterium]